MSSWTRPKAILTDNARTVLALRYLMKDEDGNPTEEPEDMFWRVAMEIAGVDKTKYGASEEERLELAQRFYEMMASGLFLPNSPTLMNAGRPLGQLSACFVLPVEDTISNGECGIYDTLKNMALIHQSGGGTGFSFSDLRPAGATVRSTMGVASGPVSFMRLYDASTDVIKQGGTRRGANMGILRVDHPDIREFVTCKADTSQITNFNISVAITDKFMECVKERKEYPLIDPRTDQVVRMENAREIFDMIVDGAWKTGEPGVFFIDAANRANPVPRLGTYDATNPCGEQPLLPYDVCNLGSINVGAFVDQNSGDVDWDALQDTIDASVHFLDNVIDANNYPIPRIGELAQNIRRIGLGVMGWADMLVRMGIPYNSKDALLQGTILMAYIDDQAKIASEELAKKRGVFPEWDDSVWGEDFYCARDEYNNRIRGMRRLRNCNLTTVAPTGTISIIAGCSGGIEPLFAVAFKRNQAGVQMPDVNEDFSRIARDEGWYSDDLINKIVETGHIHHDEVPERVQKLFVTSHDVSPEQHVRMQAAFQKSCDSAISKTTNFPKEATREDVRKIYVQAFESGCKGVTVYRDGSRPMQVLSTGKTESGQEPQVVKKRKRPSMLSGRTIGMECPLGDLYVTINEDDEGRPFEVFCTLGKAGGAAMADAEAIGRLASLSLRSGTSIKDVRNQLRGISCDRAVGMGEAKVLSAPDAIGQAIDQYIKETEKEHTQEPEQGVYIGACPDCGSGQIAFEEGCVTCHVCGYSQCL